MTKNRSIRKYSFYIFSIVLLITLLVLTTAFPASAADPLDTDAQIELEPGIMEITEVPLFGFGADIAVLRKSGGGVVGGHIDGKFVLEDARGNSAGWSVYVSLGTFRNRNTTTGRPGIGRPSLTLHTPDIKSATSSATFKGYHTVMVAGDNNFYKLASVPPGTKGGTWNVILPGADLRVSKDGSIVGEFQAKLNWSIQDTP